MENTNPLKLESKLHSIRFLLFPRGEEIVTTISEDATFEEIREILLRQWPKKISTIPIGNELQFIHSGKMVEDKSKLNEVLKFGDDNQRQTIHMAIKKNKFTNKNAKVESNTKTTQLTTPIPPHNDGNHTGDVLPEDWHLHGCTFNEEEASRMFQIFNQKKGKDDLMEFDEVLKFLKVYWKWMAKNKHHDANLIFPEDSIHHIKDKVISKSIDRINCEQFLQIFFLFDNHSPEDICPHGSQLRVQKATEEMHKSMKGSDTTFEKEIFDSLFEKLDKDKDGSLTCRDLELFFYLYCVEITSASSSS